VVEIASSGAREHRQAGVRHRVRRGETLQVIARRYGTTVAALKRENGIRDPRRIRENQVVRIPGRRNAGTQKIAVAAAAVPVGRGEHLVRRGETLDRIAIAYGTTADALRQENGIGDPRRIRAGQVIRIPHLDSPQPPSERPADDVAAGHGSAAAGSTAGEPQPTPVDPASGSPQAEAGEAESPSQEPQEGGEHPETPETEGTSAEEGRHRGDGAPAQAVHPEEPRPAGPPREEPASAAAELSAPPLDVPQKAESRAEVKPGEPQQGGAAAPAEVHGAGLQGSETGEKREKAESSPRSVSGPTDPVSEKIEPMRRRPGGRRHRARRSGGDLTKLAYPRAVISGPAGMPACA
jgi:LysM repeat protein